MKRKSRLRKAIVSLAICAGIFCAWCCVLLMFGEYSSARQKLDVHRLELQTWEACRQTKPSYFRSNSERVNACLKNLSEAQDNLWVRLPKDQLVGLFVLAALGSAVGGGLVTWTVIWVVCLTICRFFKLVALCFRYRLSRRVS